MRAAGPIGIATLVICSGKGSYSVTGSPSRSNPFFRRIRARGTSCRNARIVTRSWIAATYGRSPSRFAYDSGGRRWSCSARFRRVGQVGQYQTVKCARRGGKRVRFRGQP